MMFVLPNHSKPTAVSCISIRLWFDGVDVHRQSWGCRRVYLERKQAMDVVKGSASLIATAVYIIVRMIYWNLVLDLVSTNVYVLLSHPIVAH